MQAVVQARDHLARLVHRPTAQVVGTQSLQQQGATAGVGAQQAYGAAPVPVPRATVGDQGPLPQQVGDQSRDGVYFFSLPDSPVDSAAMKASWGTSTRPTIFIRFLPSFCFSSSLRLRLMSPP